jgi:hypothetical protein
MNTKHTLQIGDKVRKKSGKPFKSKLYVETVKGYTTNQNHPNKSLAIVFDDESICNINMLMKVEESDRKIWLEDAILAFIQNNSQIDSVDICLNFNLRSDITLDSLSELVNNKKVIRKHISGSRYGYVIL